MSRPPPFLPSMWNTVVRVVVFFFPFNNFSRTQSWIIHSSHGEIPCLEAFFLCQTQEESRTNTTWSGEEDRGELIRGRERGALSFKVSVEIILGIDSYNRSGNYLYLMPSTINLSILLHLLTPLPLMLIISFWKSLSFFFLGSILCFPFPSHLQKICCFAPFLGFSVCSIQLRLWPSIGQWPFPPYRSSCRNCVFGSFIIWCWCFLVRRITFLFWLIKGQRAHQNANILSCLFVA